MRTRLRSTSRAGFVALGFVLAATAACPLAHAQTSNPAEDEVALRRELGVARWAAPGAARTGVTALASLVVPGVQLRDRRDRVASEGGITLSFAPAGGHVTLRVGVVVAPDATRARDALVAQLTAWQTRLVPLRDARGADVALGDSPRGVEAAAAVWGNVLVWVQRTPDAGSETPEAARVIELLRARLGPVGAPAMPAVVLARAGAAQGGSNRVHVDVRGGAFEHVEARVTGGHLRAAPSPAGIDVVRDGTGPMTLEVTATDTLARTATATLTL